jgi:hypothetical protein
VAIVFAVVVVSITAGCWVRLQHEATTLFGRLAFFGGVLFFVHACNVWSETTPPPSLARSLHHLHTQAENSTHSCVQTLSSLRKPRSCHCRQGLITCELSSSHTYLDRPHSHYRHPLRRHSALFLQSASASDCNRHLDHDSGLVPAARLPFRRQSESRGRHACLPIVYLATSQLCSST